MLRWHLISLRLWVSVTIAIQVLSGVGMVYGIGLLAHHLSHTGELYATTGPAAVALLLVGAIFGPQIVAQQKIDGSYQYLLTLPVPRSATALAWYVVTLAIGLPAAAAALAAGVLRFGVSLSLSAELLPAVLLGCLATTMLGYAIAHAISKPMITIVVAELIVFFPFGFAPFNFPASQMPAWLVDVNHFLPFLPMATVIRAGLTHGITTDVGLSYLALAVWAVAMTAATLAVLRRRG